MAAADMHATDLGSAGTGAAGPTSAVVSEARRAVLNRRIRIFVAATITYNVLEAAVALTAGHLASSSALIGFGLDSLIEVASAAAVAWQFSATDPESREKMALRIIAVSFFALAAFVSFDAIRSLVFGIEPGESMPGIVLAAVSLAIMPVLSWAQRRAGRELGSRSAVADSKQTLLCTYLSAVLLLGLVLNAWLGWSWADPVAALVIAAVALKEGREAWRGDACCPPNAGVRRGGAAHCADEAAHNATPASAGELESGGAIDSASEVAEATTAGPRGAGPTVDTAAVDTAAVDAAEGEGCACCSPSEETSQALRLGLNTAPPSNY